MRILITNDDSVRAEQLVPLIKACRTFADVTVVVPKQEQSAKSHSIEIRQAFEIKQQELEPGLKVWTVDSTPVETLDLQLPRQLDGDWAAYARLQEEQGLPFLPCAGKQVRRYTYRVSNYPGREKDVQANLYVCDDQVVGGDIMGLGENGFQAGLAFPQQEKT